MRRADGGISRGSNRAPSLTSVLPPKAQHNQGLLTPPATSVSGCHRADGTQLFAPRFVPEIYLLLRKGHPGAFPLGFASLSTPQRQPSEVQDARWLQQIGGHSAHLGGHQALSHSPSLGWEPPWALWTIFGPWPELLSSPGRLLLRGLHIIYGYQTHTHTAPPRADVNAWSMFPNRAIMDLNDSIFRALAARCFQKPHVLSLS